MSGHTGSAHELGDVEAGHRSSPSLASNTGMAEALDRVCVTKCVLVAADLAEQRKRRFA
jgi:hypothetical protein